MPVDLLEAALSLKMLLPLPVPLLGVITVAASLVLVVEDVVAV
jgi:hypothetical protein